MGLKPTVKKSNDGTKFVVICSCGNECHGGEERVCKKCAEKLKKSVTQGYLYEKSETKTLNRFWYTLAGAQLYRYKVKTDTESNGMYSL